MTTKTITALDNYFYNSHRYKPLAGRTWTVEQFQRRFQKYFPYIASVDITDLQSRMKLIAAYTDINKVLRKRGMAMKSSNYYTSFTIIRYPEKKIQHLTRIKGNIIRHQSDLFTGWCTYGNAYTARLKQNEISDIANRPSFNFGRKSYGN